MNMTSADDRALVDLVRRVDHDRFLCALFAPRDRRAALFALIAFNHEIARVRETVSEPLLGRIRLQWWREAIQELYDGTPRRHEVVTALALALECHALSRRHFDALIDARERDLDDQPPPDMAALEAYAEATGGPLGALMAEALGAGAVEAAVTAARHAAVAFALVGLMRAVPFHARQSRLYIPADRLAAHGLSPADVLAGRFVAPLGAVIGEVLIHVDTYVADVRRSSSNVLRSVRAALLPATLATIYAARLRALDHDPYDPRLSIGPLGRQLRLWTASLIGRV